MKSIGRLLKKFVTLKLAEEQKTIAKKSIGAQVTTVRTSTPLPPEVLTYIHNARDNRKRLAL